MKKLFSAPILFLLLSTLKIQAEPFAVNGSEFAPCNFWNCKNGVFEVKVDYIYWKPHEDNLVYAFDGVTTVETGSSKELDWEWSSGFQVGVGYSFCATNWDIFANYTWYKTQATGFSLARPGPVVLFPTFGYDLSPALVTAAGADWSLRYQTIDLEIGNSLSLSRFFNFRPYFGVRGAFTRDNDTITYVSTGGNSSYIFSQRFNGVGPRFGANASWFLTPNLSIFGEGALTLLWGEYDVNMQAQSGVNAIANTTHSFDDLRYLADAKIGINWDTCLFNCYRLSFHVAWEQRLWIKHNQYQRIIIAPASSYRDNDGDLSLYGIDAGVCVFF